MGRRIARWTISLVIVAAVAIALYSYLYAKASRGVKEEVLKIVDEMAIDSAMRPKVRRLIEESHEEAMKAALDIGRELGRKFDPQRYLDELFTQVEARARAEGLTRMADLVAQEKTAFRLDTTER